MSAPTTELKLEREQSWDKDSTSTPSTGPKATSTETDLMPMDHRIRRKIDLHVIPIVAVLYLLSFLDRGNIGNARVAGMGTDLNLTGVKFQIAAAVFFIPYSLAEIPCNVILKLMRPSLWISLIMFAWGLVMVCMTCVKSYEGLVIARVFLGLTEAGLAPGVAYYVTQWYRRDDQARPIALYFSSASIAGAFGGLLAFAIQKLNGKAGLRGWQWIFLLEGLLTVAFVSVAYFFLPDSPKTTKFLTEPEREHVVECLRRDTLGEHSHFEMRFVWETLRDPLSWLQTLIYVGMVIPLYAFSLFIPTIILNSGVAKGSPSITQLLTIPPYTAGCLFTIGCGILSDRIKKRGPVVMGCSFLAIVGYSMLYATSPKSAPWVGYAGTILAACGVYPTVPLLLAWGSANAGANLKKGVIIAMLSTFGNLGGIASSFIYRTQDNPRFHLGHGIVIGSLCVAFTSATVATFVYHRLNKAKEEQCARENISMDRRAEFADMGCKSPLFRYQL